MRLFAAVARGLMGSIALLWAMLVARPAARPLGYLTVLLGSRATLLDPSPLPVTGDGRRDELHLGDESRPVQRFAVDGAFVPAAMTVLPLALFGLDALLSASG